MPKFTALLIAIPAPVAAAYITVLIGMLFVQGMKIVIQDGVDHRKAVVVGLSFWIGTGFQNAWIFPDLLGDGFLGVLLGNGMTSGALVAVILMVLIELTSPRRLVVTARTGVGGAELEFVSGSEVENLEDRLSYLGETPDIPDSREISFRLLRHYASSVRHQKYHGVDIVTVSVVGSR